MKVHVEVVEVGTLILGQDPVTPVGEDETEKLTVPWKPPEGVMVITSDPDAPVLKFTLVAAGLMVKDAPTLKVKPAVVEWRATPGEPLAKMVTVKVVVVVTEAVQVRLDEPVPLADNETLVAVSALHLRPVTVLLVRATVPTKLLVLSRVIVDVRDAPELPLGDVAVIVKSPT